MQDVWISGRNAYKKVVGEKNSAYLLAKHMSADLAGRLLLLLLLIRLQIALQMFLHLFLLIMLLLIHMANNVMT